MAVNQSSQKINIANEFVILGKTLADTWGTIQKFNQVYVKSGVVFSAGDFDNSTLAFVDPTTMGTLVTQLNAFVTWMNTGGTGDIFFRDSNGL